MPFHSGVARRKKARVEGHGLVVLTVAVIDGGQDHHRSCRDLRFIAFAAARSRRLRTTILRSASARDSGAISEAASDVPHRRNEVFRDVGSEEHAPDDPDFIEIREIPYEPSCAYLLCSDGLSDAIPSSEILRIVEAKAGDRWGSRARVDRRRNGAPGKDNVSAVLIEGEQFASLFGRSSVYTGVAASDGEDTGRLTPAAASAPRRPWYVAPALILAGIIVGSWPGLRIRARHRSAASPAAAASDCCSRPRHHLRSLGAGAAGRYCLGRARRVHAETIQLKTGVAIISAQPYEAVLNGPVIADGVRQSRLEGFRVQAGRPSGFGSTTATCGSNGTKSRAPAMLPWNSAAPRMGL